MIAAAAAVDVFRHIGATSEKNSSCIFRLPASVELEGGEDFLNPPLKSQNSKGHTGLQLWTTLNAFVDKTARDHTAYGVADFNFSFSWIITIAFNFRNMA